MGKKIAIIQASPYRTGSTLLVNALFGFLIPTQGVTFCDIPSNVTKLSELKKQMGNLLMFKTHKWQPNTQNLWRNYIGSAYECYFVMSERKDKGIQVGIDNDRTLVIPYEVLLETSTHSLETIIDVLYDRVSSFLPSGNELDRTACLNRIRKMNERYLEIKDKSFSYIEPFYSIHGHHRNRDRR